jgi:hypothetical protein
VPFHLSSRFSSSFACSQPEELAGQNKDEYGIVFGTIQQFATSRNLLKKDSDIRTKAEYL